MKIMKKILFVILAIFVIAIICMFLIGKKYHFETSMLIKAPIEKVYEQASSSQKFNQWNPWLDLDPTLKINYSGTQGEVGDEYCWKGNEDVGEGCHVITGLVPNQKVETKMMFKLPFESDATSDIILTKEGADTKVTWSMDCELDYPMNLMKIFMDSQMEKSYTKGLNKLKSIVE